MQWRRAVLKILLLIPMNRAGTKKRKAYKMKKIEKEVQALSQLIEQSQTRLDAIQEEHGSDVEMEEVNRKQKQLTKNYKTDLESQMKEIAAAKNLGQNL